MILKPFTAFATEAAPILANHLWQSTLFVIVAALLTLLLRKNQARVRHGLWFAASVKFLVPFSLLMSLGSHLAVRHGPVRMQTTLYAAAEQASQPFTQHAVTAVSMAAAPRLLSLLPEILALIWFCGFAAALGRWAMGWRRVLLAKRAALSVTNGREVDALRDLERTANVRSPIPFLLSHDSMEPGIFGIVRPALIWPAGISAHLDDAHLKAILAHELWHVRRRDNLAAALHMLVEALFWFYPLVWWLGSRLIEERERACDEAVLQLNNEPEVYAESILKACEFCVESPLSCVSGVTSSDLKRRIVRIMTQQLAERLTLGRKLILASFATAAIALPICFGIADAPVVAQTQTADGPIPPYQVVTLKVNTSGEKITHIEFLPGGGFIATNSTLRHLIEVAYGAKDFELSGGPSWIDSDHYDIDVRTTEGGKRYGLPKRTLQAVLADRFNLKLSQQTKVVPVYALIVASGGSKLIASAEPPPSVDVDGKREVLISVKTRVLNGTGQLRLNGSLENFAKQLSGPLGTPVVDRTGLKGTYDIALRWTEAGDQSPDIVSAIQDQLGLTLQPDQAPVQVFVIDSIEAPTAN